MLIYKMAGEVHAEFYFAAKSFCKFKKNRRISKTAAFYFRNRQLRYELKIKISSQ